MRRGQRLVGALWRWHRRIGLVAALFALLLAATGIALNHSGGLALDKSYVQWPWLLSAYGDESTQRTAYAVDAGWISRAASGALYLDATQAATCSGDLVGALVNNGIVVAACAEELVLLLPDGQLIETIASSAGLPTPLTGIGVVNGKITVQVTDEWRLADLDALDFAQPAPAGAMVQQITSGTLPEKIASALPATQQWLTWERLLLDLHSGRVFGYAGVLVMDAAAILLMCLASSGVAMWLLHRRRRARS